MKSKFYTFLILNLSVVATLFSQQGQLDLTFGVKGIVKQSYSPPFPSSNEPQSLALLNDGKFMVAGRHNFSMVFARFEEDGKLDLSFGDSGAVYIDYAWLATDYVSGLIVQPDGNAIALVQSYRISPETQEDWSKIYIMRFTPDWDFDHTFGNATTYSPKGVAKVETGFEVTTVSSFQLLQDGKILVVGWARSSFSNNSRTYIAKLNADGTPDSSFGTFGVIFPIWDEPKNNIRQLDILPDEKILLSGSAWTSNGTLGYFITRLNKDGSLDSNFGTNGRVVGTLPSGNYYVQRLFVLEDGNLLAWVNGDLFPPLSLDVIRLKPDGSFDTAFGTNGITHIPNEKIHRISRILMDDEGSFFLAGTWTDSIHYNRYDFALAKLSPDYNWVGEFGNSGVVVVQDTANHDILRTAAILPDGKVLLAGSASPIYYITNMKLAKYFGRDTTVTSDTPPIDSLIINENGLTIFPNPVDENFSLCYPLSEKSILKIDLYDSSGRLLHVFLDKTVRDTGVHCEQFNWPSDVGKGVYFINLSGRNFAYGGKIMKY